MAFVASGLILVATEGRVLAHLRYLPRHTTLSGDTDSNESTKLVGKELGQGKIPQFMQT